MIFTELRNSSTLGNWLTGLPHNVPAAGEVSYINYLMPWNMCWDPVSNVAEVWCCSEHYLWLFDGDLYLDPFTAQCIVVVRSFLRMLKLHKLGVRKLYLSRGRRTWCHGVLDHGLNLHQNIPLMTEIRTIGRFGFLPVLCQAGHPPVWIRKMLMFSSK